MSVRVNTFGRQMDENISGRTLGGQMKRASTQLPPDKFQRPSLADKAVLGLLRLKKKDLNKKSPQEKITPRAADITSQLKRAGLSDADIAKLKGKGKK